MLTSSSNVGCYKWLAETSVAISGGTPMVDSRAAGVGMLWSSRRCMPGRIAFGPSGGTIAGNTTITDACTTTMVGASKQLYRGLGDLDIPKPDGTLDFNLDLDLGFSEIGGESPNRELITLTGTTVLDTTITAVCPGVTTTSVGQHPWDWLTVDNTLSPGGPTVVYTVAADGRTIEGRFTGVTPTGSMVNTLWKFTAVRSRPGPRISCDSPPACRTTPARRSSAPSTSQRAPADRAGARARARAPQATARCRRAAPARWPGR